MNGGYTRVETDPDPIRGFSNHLVDAADFEALEFEYQLCDGHDGEVTCVDASDNFHWVISGGVDKTARIWHFNKHVFQCYRLYKDVQHADEVASVAFAGVHGPAVSVTTSGDCLVTRIRDGDKALKETTPFLRQFEVPKFEEGRVVDLRVKREEYEDAHTELLAVAAGRKAYLTELSLHTGVPVLIEKACFVHADKVLSAQHMPGDIAQGAALATATEKAICLWSLEGDTIVTLKPTDSITDPEECKFTCFNLIHAEKLEPGKKGKLREIQTWGWLAAGASHYVSLWPVSEGRVLDSTHAKMLDTAQAPKPLDYDMHQPVRIVSISPHCTSFIVQRADNATEMREIAPVQDSADGEDLVEVAAGFQIKKVFKPEAESNKTGTMVVEHTEGANEMCVRQCEGSEKSYKRMLVGFESGCVAVWEWPSRSELKNGSRPFKLAELRCRTSTEVMIPIALRFASFLQVTAFAFGPATDFAEGVDKPIKFSTKIINLNIQEFVPAVRPSMLFLPQVCTVLGLMCFYLLLVATAAPEKLADLTTQCMRQAQDGKERNVCLSKYCGPFIVGLLTILRSGIGLVIGTCSSILVVPMFKVCAMVVDCVHPEDGSKAFLSSDPDIHCYDTTHMKILGAFAVVLPLYFAALLPYAVVMGDSQSMCRKDVFQGPAQWRKKGINKATLVYQGPMHPRKESIFLTRVIELLGKIALPVIVMLTTSNHLLQTIAVTACGLMVYLGALYFPPLVDDIMCSVIQGMQLFTVLCMSCGVFTVVLPEWKELTGIMLGACLVFSLGVICFQISKVQIDPARGVRSRIARV